jgi:hypothetical protein
VIPNEALEKDAAKNARPQLLGAKMLNSNAEIDEMSKSCRFMTGHLLTGNMMRGLLFVVMLSAGINPAAAQLAGENICPDVHTPPSTITDLAAQRLRIRDAIRCLINAERRNRQLPELQSPELQLPPQLSVNTKLTNAADGHAQEAVRLRWWGRGDSHVNPEKDQDLISDQNLTPEQRRDRAIERRIIAAGYCERQPIKTGEITYSGTGNDPLQNKCQLVECSTPAAAVHWWMNVSTSGHRQSILNPEFREIGVGVSGIGADDQIPPQPSMGTYVVTFGNCGTLETGTGTGTSTPPPPPDGQAKVEVTFTKMRVHACPETGICDWELTCSVVDGGTKTFFSMKECGNACDIPINPISTLSRDGTLSAESPVTVTCKVREHDGELFSLDVWEEIGTVSKTFTTPTPIAPPEITEAIRITREDEGDVSVFFKIAQGGSTTGGLTVRPQPPLAPTGCGIAHASSPRCGGVDFECDAPLPTDEIVAAGGGGGGIRPYRVVRDIGLINAEYFSEGETVVAICARNSGGVACSNRFTVTMGPVSCPGSGSVDRPCPEGQFPCLGGECRALSQCEFLQ